MVKLTEKQGKEFLEKIGYGEQEKQRERKMKEEKIQFYPSDLEFALNVGTIADMHVETLESGIQVLRMTVLPKEKDEYKTVKLQKKQPAPAPKKQTGRSKPAESVRPKFMMDPATNDSGLASKFAKGAKQFLTQKGMKRPDEW
jgi:hypothetical protein